MRRRLSRGTPKQPDKETRMLNAPLVVYSLFGSAEQARIVDLAKAVEARREGEPLVACERLTSSKWYRWRIATLEHYVAPVDIPSIQ